MTKREKDRGGQKEDMAARSQGKRQLRRGENVEKNGEKPKASKISVTHTHSVSPTHTHTHTMDGGVRVCVTGRGDTVNKAIHPSYTVESLHALPQ